LETSKGKENIQTGLHLKTIPLGKCKGVHSRFRKKLGRPRKGKGHRVKRSGKLDSTTKNLGKERKRRGGPPARKDALTSNEKEPKEQDGAKQAQSP